MEKRDVITNVPTKLPVASTGFYLFILYYFKAGGVIWGISLTLLFIWWVATVATIINENYINLNSDDEEKKNSRSAFAKRLQKIIEDNKKDTK